MTRLELNQIGVTLGTRTLLARVSLAVEPGELVALVGPNGAGKTTLLRVALGLLRPTSGSVSLDGQALETHSHRERAGLIAWLPQEMRLAEPLSALDTVLAARFRFAETSHHAKQRARHALERLGVLSLESEPVTRLSGGERQRIALAALLAQEAKLLLLDEPANHLDPTQQAETYRLLGELAREGTGILCVTHDVNLVGYARTDARVIGLRKGELRFEKHYRDHDLPEALGALFDVPMTGLSLGEGRLIVATPNSPPGAGKSEAL